MAKTSTLTAKKTVAAVALVLIGGAILVAFGIYALSPRLPSTLSTPIPSPSPYPSPSPPAPSPSSSPSPSPSPTKTKCVDPDGVTGLGTADIVLIYSILDDGTERLINEIPSTCVRQGFLDTGYKNSIQEAYCYNEKQGGLLGKQKCPAGQVCKSTQVMSERTPGVYLKVGYCSN